MFFFVVIAVVVAFIAGVVVSQTVKDWFAGVPATLRADLDALEGHIKSQVSGAQKAVLADVHAVVAPAVVVPPVAVTMPVPKVPKP